MNKHQQKLKEMRRQNRLDHTLINSVDAETGLLYDIDTFELWNRRN